MKKRLSPVFWLSTGLLVGLLLGALMPAAYSLLTAYDYQQVVGLAGETAVTRGELAERALFRHGTKILDEDVRRVAIIKEAARRDNITVSEAEVDKRIVEYKLLLTQYGDLAELVGSGLAFEVLPDWLLRDEFRTALYAEKLMGIRLSEKEQAEKMDNMYTVHMDSFKKPAMANLTMIVCTDEHEAGNLYKRLKAGEDATALSARYSAYQPIRDIQGKMGWVAQTQMNQQLAAAIFGARRGKGLKAKEFTDVIEYEWVVDQDVRDPANKITEPNYVIFYLNDDIVPAKMVPKKDVLPVLEMLVRLNEISVRQDKWLNKLEQRIPWQRVENLTDPLGKPAPIKRPAGAADIKLQ